jgi:glutathione peroxidase
MSLKSFAGRVLLIVNTASFCGYTPQYRGLQSVAEKSESRRLTVIGADFGRQDPKNESEIKTFCQGTFGVTFPLTQKQVVFGDGAHPFYKWAAAVLGKESVPAWNFHKYLVGRDGHLIGFFRSSVTPECDELQSAITRALAKTSPAL